MSRNLSVYSHFPTFLEIVFKVFRSYCLNFTGNCNNLPHLISNSICVCCWRRRFSPCGPWLESTFQQKATHPRIFGQCKLDFKDGTKWSLSWLGKKGWRGKRIFVSVHVFVWFLLILVLLCCALIRYIKLF